MDKRTGEEMEAGAQNVEVAAARLHEKAVLRNLVELYQYDFSELDGSDVDQHGLFGYRYLDHYWTEPGRYPFLIRVDGRLAGFALVRRGSYLKHPGAPPEEVAMTIAEFFVMRKYRRRGVGARVARELFERFPGRWEVGEIEQNAVAQSFWRKVIGELTGGRFEEVFRDDSEFRGPIQVFYI
jgi:predicted acetyltransferase